VNRDRFRRSPRRGAADAPVSFVCNVCGATATAPRSELRREQPSCPACHSTVRFRSVVAALSEALHGSSLVIDAFPPRPDLVGLGMSDWTGYADRLPRVLGYDNTFYDEGIRLDITADVPHALTGSCDFVVSSDVLEHVAPPFSRALVHLRQLLKPGGVLVLTVPMLPDGTTVEHFPDLDRYEIAALGDRRVLVNRTRDGELQVFDDLVFHGGPGVTLEMRICSLPDVLAGLRQAGFVDVRPFERPIPEHGIVWDSPEWPIVARAPGTVAAAP
jgi:SAM-dependent methyltransferase